MFFSILSKRLEKHNFSNNYSFTKKGCMERFPGCWEHYITVIWLDITYACGSVIHQLLVFALRWYGIPEHWLSLFIKYYEGFWSITWSDLAPSSCHHHLRGIFIACTACITLFLCSVTKIEIYNTMASAPVRAFMDDMFLMSESIPGTQVLQDCCAVVF